MSSNITTARRPEGPDAGPELSGEPAVDPHDDLFGEQHRHDDDDQRDDPVKNSVEMHVMPEREGDRLEDHEFRAEQHQPGAEEAQGHPGGARLSGEKAGDLVLDGDGQLEEDLQQHGREQRNRESTDMNAGPIFGEKIKHRQVDQDAGKVAYK